MLTTERLPDILIEIGSGDIFCYNEFHCVAEVLVVVLHSSLHESRVPFGLQAIFGRIAIGRIAILPRLAMIEHSRLTFFSQLPHKQPLTHKYTSTSEERRDHVNHNER
jgi:hypothetical protein